MKILYYIEPHPIRDSTKAFNVVFTDIAKMVQDEYAHRQFNRTTNHANIKILTTRYYSPFANKFPKISKQFIGLTADENNALSYFMGQWDEERMQIWMDLMRGEGEVTEFYKKILRRIKKDVFDFDVIVYWSTNGAVKCFAQEESIYSISMELGCTREPFYQSIYFDPLGSNGNSITNYFDIDSVEDCDKEYALSLLPFFHKNNSTTDAMFNVVESSYANEIYESKKRVLIPLQLDDDSNVLIFSRFKNTLEFLKYVVPILLEKGYTCFIKPHPAAVHREYCNIGSNNCENFVKDIEGVVWLDDIQSKDYVSLLTKMDLVVTINSSVGFEALILGKDVVVEGEGAYSIGALPTLKKYFGRSFDKKRYEINKRKIVNMMVFYYLADKRKVFSYEIFMQYIFKSIDILNAYRTMDKKEFTKYFMSIKSYTKDNFYFLGKDSIKFASKSPISKNPTQPSKDLKRNSKRPFRKKLRDFSRHPIKFFTKKLYK